MSKKPVALVVDDEADIRELAKMALLDMQIQVIEASDLAEAKQMLVKHTCDFCLTDMRLPDGTGIELLEFIQKQYTHIPVAVITAFGNVELAVSSLKAGAFDFISKPLDINILRRLVDTALRLTQETREKPQLGEQLLGEAPVMIELRRKIAKVARSQAPVYIHGPSGSGKELVARLIHDQGARRDKSFIAVNCGAIPSELMESEFFGHKKGSFTGAVSDKDGLFQAASGGTLFLDEVAELPITMQVKLLRAIQEKAIRPVGGQREITVDVRILSASHKQLGRLVESGDFRHDLFYRINVIEVLVPALKQRLEDIPMLATVMLNKLCQEDGKQIDLADSAIKKLQGYVFPGNVRELENILERAMTLCENKTIVAEDIHLPETLSFNDSAIEANESLNPYLGDVERDAIILALEKTKWNKTAAAKLLGITLRALRYRVKKYNID